MPANPPGSITVTEPYESYEGPPGAPVIAEFVATRAGTVNVTQALLQVSQSDVQQHLWLTLSPVAPVGPFPMQYGQIGAAGPKVTRFT